MRYDPAGFSGSVSLREPELPLVMLLKRCPRKMQWSWMPAPRRPGRGSEAGTWGLSAWKCLALSTSWSQGPSSLSRSKTGVEEHTQQRSFRVAIYWTKSGFYVQRIRMTLTLN